MTLPKGAQIHPSLRLLSWHPRGVLDAALAEEVLHFIETAETNDEKSFNRFTNLSGVDAIHLTFAEVEQIATRRAGHYRGASVKSAILALNPLAFGMARMYEQLMRRTPIEVRVFCRLSSAAAWLKAPIEVLASV